MRSVFERSPQSSRTTTTTTRPLAAHAADRGAAASRRRRMAFLKYGSAEDSSSNRHSRRNNDRTREHARQIAMKLSSANSPVSIQSSSTFADFGTAFPAPPVPKTIVRSTARVGTARSSSLLDSTGISTSSSRSQQQQQQQFFDRDPFEPAPVKRQSPSKTAFETDWPTEDQSMFSMPANSSMQARFTTTITEQSQSQQSQFRTPVATPERIPVASNNSTMMDRGTISPALSHASSTGGGGGGAAARRRMRTHMRGAQKQTPTKPLFHRSESEPIAAQNGGSSSNSTNTNTPSPMKRFHSAGDSSPFSKGKTDHVAHYSMRGGVPASSNRSVASNRTESSNRSFADSSNRSVTSEEPSLFDSQHETSGFTFDAFGLDATQINRQVSEAMQDLAGSEFSFSMAATDDFHSVTSRSSTPEPGFVDGFRVASSGGGTNGTGAGTGGTGTGTGSKPSPSSTERSSLTSDSSDQHHPTNHNNGGGGAVNVFKEQAGFHRRRRRVESKPVMVLGGQQQQQQQQPRQRNHAAPAMPTLEPPRSKPVVVTAAAKTDYAVSSPRSQQDVEFFDDSSSSSGTSQEPIVTVSQQQQQQQQQEEKKASVCSETSHTVSTTEETEEEAWEHARIAQQRFQAVQEPAPVKSFRSSSGVQVPTPSERFQSSSSSSPLQSASSNKSSLAQERFQSSPKQSKPTLTRAALSTQDRLLSPPQSEQQQQQNKPDWALARERLRSPGMSDSGPAPTATTAKSEGGAAVRQFHSAANLALNKLESPREAKSDVGATTTAVAPAYLGIKLRKTGSRIIDDSVSSSLPRNEVAPVDDVDDAVAENTRPLTYREKMELQRKNAAETPVVVQDQPKKLTYRERRELELQQQQSSEEDQVYAETSQSEPLVYGERMNTQNQVSEPPKQFNYRERQELALQKPASAQEQEYAEEEETWQTDNYGGRQEQSELQESEDAELGSPAGPDTPAQPVEPPKKMTYRERRELELKKQREEEELKRSRDETAKAQERDVAALIKRRVASNRKNGSPRNQDPQSLTPSESLTDQRVRLKPVAKPDKELPSLKPVTVDNEPEVKDQEVLCQAVEDNDQPPTVPSRQAVSQQLKQLLPARQSQPSPIPEHEVHTSPRRAEHVQQVFARKEDVLIKPPSSPHSSDLVIESEESEVQKVKPSAAVSHLLELQLMQQTLPSATKPKSTSPKRSLHVVTNDDTSVAGSDEFVKKSHTPKATKMMLNAFLAGRESISSSDGVSASLSNEGAPEETDKTSSGESLGGLPALKDDPTYKRFFKMLSIGMPMDVVKHAMTREGLDPDVMDGDHNKPVGLPLKLDPAYSKYFRMLSFGLPMEAVKHAMERDGLDSHVMDQDHNLPAKSGPKLADENEAEKDSHRRARLHWKTLRKVTSRSLWAKIDQEVDLNNIEIDEEEFQELFQVERGADAPTASKNSEPVKKGASVRVIDAKRANNGGIILARLKMSHDEMADAVDRINEEALSAEQIEHIIEYLPSKEERRALEAYMLEGGQDAAEKFEGLCECEKFMVSMMTVKHAKRKVRALLFKLQFESCVRDIQQDAFTVEEACDELSNSVRLRQLLGIILEFGNRLNTAGNGKQKAGAFTLDSLLKLNQAKAFDKKTTFLSYVVRIVKRNNELLVNFQDDIQTVFKADKIAWDQCVGDLEEVENQLENVRKIALYQAQQAQAYRLRKKNKHRDDDEESLSGSEGALSLEEEVEALKSTPVGCFALSAIKYISALRDKVEETKAKFVHLLEYFGEDDKNMQPHHLFTTIVKFCRDFEKAKEQVIATEKRKLREERKRQAAASSKAGKPPTYSPGPERKQPQKKLLRASNHQPSMSSLFAEIKSRGNDQNSKPTHTHPTPSESVRVEKAANVNPEGNVQNREPANIHSTRDILRRSVVMSSKPTPVKPGQVASPQKAVSPPYDEKLSDAVEEETPVATSVVSEPQQPPPSPADRMRQKARLRRQRYAGSLRSSTTMNASPQKAVSSAQKSVPETRGDPAGGSRELASSSSSGRMDSVGNGSIYSRAAALPREHRRPAAAASEKTASQAVGRDNGGNALAPTPRSAFRHRRRLEQRRIRQEATSALNSSAGTGLQ